MKITEKDKKTLQVLAIFLIVGLTIANIFYPKVITSVFSVNSIEEKKQTINDLNLQIASDEKVIKDSRTQLESIQDSNDSTELELKTLRAKINSEDLVFHMPSVLISLEQNAIKNNISLTIEYDKIISANQMAITDNQEIQASVPVEPQQEQTQDGQTTEGQTDTGAVTDSIGETTQTQPTADNTSTTIPTVIDNNVTSTPTTTVTTTNDVTTEEVVPDKMDTILGNYVAPQINNVNTTIVPIRISGKYSDLRKFIRYLDSLEYMDPGYIDLQSDGTNVDGIVIINIFHGGGF